MKKIRFLSALVSIAVIIAALCSCGKSAVLKSDEEIQSFIQEYYGNEYLVLSQKSYSSDLMLAWITSDAGIMDYCIAATFRSVSDGGYEFICFEPTQQIKEKIWQCYWQGGSGYFINNPECTKIAIEKDNSTSSIAIGKTPSEFFCRDAGISGLSKVRFYKENNREILY